MLQNITESHPENELRLHRADRIWENLGINAWISPKRVLPLRRLSVSSWFATALLSLGSRLGSPPRHFYGGRAFICVLCFASLNCVLCC